MAGCVSTWLFSRYHFSDIVFSSVFAKHCKRILEKGIGFAHAVIPESLSNKALMRLTVTLISELIFLSPYRWAGSQKVSCFVILLYFKDDVAFVVKTGLCSKWLQVNGKISQHWEAKLWLLKINCSVGAQVFQTCCLVHSCIVSSQLLVLLCSWRQLLTLNLSEWNIYNISERCSFLKSYTITNA